AGQGRILLAAPISLAEIEARFSARIEAREELTFDAASASLRARGTRRFGAVVLAEQAQPVKPNAESARMLADGIVRIGLDRLPWTKALRQWRDRIIFLRAAEGDEWPDLSDAALAATLADWLAPVLQAKTSPPRTSPVT